MYNVLMILNSVEIGGGNRAMETLALGLRRESINPVIVMPGLGPATQMFKEHGFNVQVIKYTQPSFLTPLLLVKQFLSWICLLRRHHINIVHANGTLAARSIAFAAWLNGTPLISHVRYHMGDDFYLYAFKFIPSPGAFIFVSNYMEKNIKPILQKTCQKSSYYVVHDAMVLSYNSPVIIRDVVKRIGIIANLQAVKGHEDFIQMAALLIKDYPDLQFDIVGADIQNQHREIILKKLVKQLNLKNKVIFHGFISGVLPFIDDLDIVVCSSHEEPLGICMIEAMSRGKSVVVTNVGGLPEVVINGENGYVVQPNNPLELYQACKILLNNKEIRFDIAKNNIDRVNNIFSQEIHVRKIQEIYSHFNNNSDQVQNNQ